MCVIFPYLDEFPKNVNSPQVGPVEHKQKTRRSVGRVIEILEWSD
jgi:hypothetical protein